MDPWGVAAPRFGGAAALPIEIEGKAAGGRAAAAHLVVVCCVGTRNPRKCSFLPRNVTLVCRFVPIVRHSLHVGWRNLFSVVLLCQFLFLAGNRFWFYILIMYLEYNTVVVLC